MKRFEVWLVSLDPTVGSEMRKTRPSVIVSPDELNRRLDTVIAAPLTGAQRPWPWRINTQFAGKPGQIALDQLRSLSVKRFRKYLGQISGDEARAVAERLASMFSH